MGCLPSSETKDYSGSASTISGWGGTIGYGRNEQQPQQPKQCTLKETIVKLIASSDPMCSKLPGLATSSKIKLCAFAKDTDTCQGDSGGPLTVPENGKYTLVGVVSYGWGCASSTPGIYARVQGFLPWIKNLISSGECSGSTSGSSAEQQQQPSPPPRSPPPLRLPTATTTIPTMVDLLERPDLSTIRFIG